MAIDNQIGPAPDRYMGLQYKSIWPQKSGNICNDINMLSVSTKKT